MVTICIPCRKGTGVGEEGGAMGLPTMEETPRGDGDHALSPTLGGGDPDTAETFGWLYSGFRAVGLTLHMLEAYRKFLETHTGEGHRLYDWLEGHQDPPAGFDGKYKLRLYEPPEGARGYVMAFVVFECVQCGQSLASDGSTLVRPFEPHVLSTEALHTFRERTVRPAECNFFEAYPFDIEYVSLETWFEAHEGHPIRLRLEEE
jgi:hypothetical protein